MPFCKAFFGFRQMSWFEAGLSATARGTTNGLDPLTLAAEGDETA
jgi:hypothetical protein